MKATQFGKGPEIVTAKDLAAWLLHEDAVWLGGDDLIGGRVYSCRWLLARARPAFWRMVLAGPVFQALYKVDDKP